MSELAFFSALRGLRHLYFLLDKNEVGLHESCESCFEVSNFINTPRYRGPKDEDWESAFSSALEGLKHLYFLLEEAKLDLHSACDGCYEIRNFLNTPGYRGNWEDPIGVKYNRPLSEYDFNYQKALVAEKPLFET